MSYVVTGRDSRNGKTWNLSLDALAVGMSGEGEGFRGRPALVSRLLPGFQKQVQGCARSSAYDRQAYLRYFWRFLDYFETLSKSLPGVQPVKIDDVNWLEISRVWRQFIDWLRAQKVSPNTRYRANWAACTVWQDAHQVAVESGETEVDSITVYIFFNQDKTLHYDNEALDFDDAKTAFKALANGWRDITRRIDRGRASARSGQNPAIGSGNRQSKGTEPIGWKNIANRLWAAQEFALRESDLEYGVYSKIRNGLSKSRIPEDWRIPGLDLLDVGFSAHLQCLFLTQIELAVAFAMVSMKSGMNQDAIARMRVDGWHRPDLTRPDERIIIYGPKRRGNYNLTAASSIKRLTDPYQIIQRVIEIQSPLRAKMFEDGTTRGDEDLIERSKLIWVYVENSGKIADFAPNKIGGSSYGSAAAQNLLNQFFIVRDIRRRDGEHMRYRFSDGRDVWGLFVYHKSGFNHILAAQSLGHSSLTSLLHYLEKRVIMVEDRKRLIDLHDRVLTGLKGGRYDPRDYRDHYPPAAEMAATGLLCTDSLHPDPGADPGNPGGKPCRGQACWTCGKWYATKESIRYLLRMIMDLDGIMASTPLALWETSDYPFMHAIYGHILGKFASALVDMERQAAARMPPILSPHRFVGRAA